MVNDTAQEVSLDDMAKLVVEWMDGWCIQETKPMTMIVRDGRMSLALTQLYESLDVIREVEEELFSYAEIPWGFYRERVISKTKRPLLADPETRLRAIYRTLKETDEIE